MKTEAVVVYNYISFIPDAVQCTPSVTWFVCVALALLLLIYVQVITAWVMKYVTKAERSIPFCMQLLRPNICSNTDEYQP